MFDMCLEIKSNILTIKYNVSFIMRFLFKNKKVLSDDNSLFIRVKRAVIKNKKIEV